MIFLWLISLVTSIPVNVVFPQEFRSHIREYYNLPDFLTFVAGKLDDKGVQLSENQKIQFLSQHKYLLLMLLLLIIICQSRSKVQREQLLKPYKQDDEKPQLRKTVFEVK